MTETILVVDDERDILDLIVYNLQKAGYRTLTANDGESALRKADESLPALVMLDLMLPVMEGTEVCKRLKADPRTRHIPIIMLTAKAEELDRVLGLELGADDYVTKPFSPRELMLRVKSVLRRVKAAEGDPEILKYQGLLVNVARHQVTFHNKPLELTSTEFNLLVTLMKRCGRVQTRDRLLEDVWDYSPDTDTRTVDTHIRRLREKLGKAGDWIETVRGSGYRFTD